MITACIPTTPIHETNDTHLTQAGVHAVFYKVRCASGFEKLRHQNILHAKTRMHTSKRTQFRRAVKNVCTPACWHILGFSDLKQCIFHLWIISSNFKHFSETACTPLTSHEPYMEESELYMVSLTSSKWAWQVCMR